MTALAFVLSLAVIAACILGRRAIDEIERLSGILEEIERQYLEWANSDDDSDAKAVALVDGLGELISKAKPGVPR